MKADLHLHTTASDGRLEPQELVKLAAETGLDVIAITDHDTIDGVSPSLIAAEKYPSLTVIPGLEISTDVSNGEVHILGYFIDYTDDNLLNRLNEMRNSRELRAKKMVAKLNDLSMEIKWQRVQELAQDGTVGRPHIAQALLEAGYINSMREAFDKYISHSGPAYVERDKMLPVDAVKLITNAKGLPVLAHPTYVGNLNKLIPDLIKAGLIGLEACYGKYTPGEIRRMKEMAGRYGLIPTGGSDYHAFGDNSEAMIGSALAPPQ
ncbi:PHP domain-containing protein, partial [Chloroflexota bacterium]